jgi:hypothetical protein
MAVVGSSETQVRGNSDITKLTSDPHCICCQHLQELETVLQELQNAKQIIELLHADTLLHRTPMQTQGGNASFVSSAINSDLEKNTADIWRKVSYSRRKYNSQKYNNHLNRRL